MAENVLRDAIRIRGRFHRSVQLVRDWADQRGFNEYLLTPTARAIAMQILGGVRSKEGARAWSITGLYGTGKSAFALFLTDLLANEIPKHPEGRAIRDSMPFEYHAFIPVLVVGQRTSLIPELLRALGQSLIPVDKSLSEEVNTAADDRKINDREAVNLFEKAAVAVINKGYQGLYVVIDEFGKFLEHAGQHPESEDIFMLQDLAEAAARSEAPIILVTILHTAFAEYLSVLDETRRAEWQKVQGRFVDIAFLEPAEQFLKLISAAIVWREENSNLENRYANLVGKNIQSPALTETRKRLPIEELLFGCTPLHPLTALLLWPLFRSKLAQNERTLFSFLVDPAPYGFQEFLSFTTIEQVELVQYSVEQLYDYATNSLGSAIFLGDRARQWAVIEYALDRLPGDAPHLSQGVIKTVGMLLILGQAVGLRATKDTLKLAFEETKAVSEAIEYLERASIIVFRRYEKSFALWEGSDVDLDERYREAEKHVGHGKLAPRLQRIVELRPIVARAHYIKKGTLRFINVRIIDGAKDSLKTTLEENDRSADGELIFVLTPDQRKRDDLIDYAKKLTSREELSQRLLFIAFPKPMIGLENVLREVEIWSWVSDNTQALQGDPVARREVKARHELFLRRLQEIAGSVLGLRGYVFDPNASEWIHGGNLHHPISSVLFQRWLSDLCGEFYNQAPVLYNELLNRENISTAAAAGRRFLIKAMIDNADQLNLGFIGAPAEYSMYRALLKEGKFHRYLEGNWQLSEPNKEWKPVWEAMVDFIKSTEGGRRPIVELTAILKAPPFGLREGPIPVLLCVLMMVYGEQISLYEEGLYVPELRLEVFERLMRVPEIFEMQYLSMSASMREIFYAIGNALSTVVPGLEIKNARLLEVVKPLVVFAARLPDFTKRTKRIEPVEAIQIRDALLKARDPVELILNEIPESLGIPIESAETLPEFTEKLKDCLLGLRRAYPHLLDKIDEFLRLEFDLHGTSMEAREKLQSRATPLVGYAIDPTLVSFAREASRVGERDWREVLARVVNKGMPPTHWHDIDLVRFQLRLKQLSSDFTRLEELVAEKSKSGVSQVLRVGLLDGRFEEARAVVSVPPQREAEVEVLAQRITELLKGSTEDNREAYNMRVAALARAVDNILQQDGRAHDPQ